ncbi:MAG: putative aminoacrylate hydrolase RutD [bacterium]|nr:putative aminoacrylate hydrolase RutD [bacterium]
MSVGSAPYSIRQAQPTLIDSPLYVEVRGPIQAPSVLFVHGICASTSYWTCRLGALQDHLQCVTLDLLGHGRSPKPVTGSYSLEEQADAVAPVLMHLAREQGGPVPIVAHSMGNFVALELRRRHPELVSKILGMGLPYFPSKEEAYASFLQMNPFAALPVRRPWWAGPLLNTARISRGKLGYSWFHKNYGLPRDCWEDGFAVTWESLSRSLHNLILGVDVRDLLASAGTAELEWWHGTRDQSAPYRYVTQLWEAHPEVPTTTIEGGNHNVWISHNDQMTNTFLDRLVP